MCTVAGLSVTSPNVDFSMLYGRTLHPAPVSTSHFNFCIGEFGSKLSHTGQM